jgi:hypothetical protein
MRHKPDKGYVVIQNQKLNFSKTQANVNSRRKTYMQVDGHKKASHPNYNHHHGKAHTR